MSENWTPVAATRDIDEDDLIQVVVEDRLIAVYNLGGEFYATSDTCTHEYACLSDGFVIDGIIECPLHQGRFDIATGKAQGPPVSENLATYPVKVEDGRVYVWV